MAYCEPGNGALACHRVFCVDADLPGMEYEVDLPLMLRVMMDKSCMELLDVVQHEPVRRLLL
jgi:hypothetical protein